MSDVRTALRRVSGDVSVPEPAFERLLTRQQRRHRRRRVASAITALTVTLVVVAGAVAALREVATAPPTDVAADPTSDDDRLALGQDEFLYTLIRSSEATDGHIRNEQTWWALDGSGEVRNASTRQDKYSDLPTGVYGPGEFPSWSEASRAIAGLSTDPAVLAEQLQDPGTRRTLWSGDPRPWSVVGSLLFRQSDVTPSLRAALFEVATRLPGIERRENVIDSVGRRSVALTFEDEPGRFTWWYFDPDTHQPLAVASVYRGNEAAWQAMWTGIVPERGVAPASDEWLVAPPPEES